MTTSFDLTIITPNETIFDGEVVSLNIPCEGGHIGILAYHAPLVAQLSKGTIMITDSRGLKKTLPSRTGFIEVFNNEVTIIFSA